MKLYQDTVTVHNVVKCEFCSSTVDIFLVTDDREFDTDSKFQPEHYLCNSCLDELPISPKPEQEYDKEKDLC